MHYPRWYPTLAWLMDGRIVAISGADNQNPSRLVYDIDVYNGATWSFLTPGGLLYQPHWYPFMFAFPGGLPTVTTLFMAGKSGFTAPPSGGWTMQTYQLSIAGAGGQWDTLGSNPGFQGSSAAIWFAGTNPLDKGTVFKFGGPDPQYPPQLPPPFPEIPQPPPPATETCRKINLNGPLDWADIAYMSTRRGECDAVLLPDGKIVIIGGSLLGHWPMPHGTAVKSAQVYDPYTNTWSATVAWEGEDTRMYHSIAILLPDGSVLVAGGEWDNNGTSVQELNARIYYPPYFDIDSLQPVITETSPDVEMEYASTLIVRTKWPGSEIAKVTMIGLGSVTHSFDANQRFINMTIDESFNEEGAVRVYTPMNEGVAPPGWYMIFAVSAEGKPSVAKYMKIRRP